LGRNVRPARQQESEEEPDYSADEVESAGSDARSVSEVEDEDDGAEDGEDGEDPEQMLSRVSFGALKHAQDGLSKKRKRGSNETPDQDAKLDAIRERLRELREKKGVTAGKIASRKVDASRKPTQFDEDDEEDGSDSDSSPSEEGAQSARSKHAPMAQSSKHQVTRKRQVIDLPNRKIRDPRFDALQQRNVHPGDNSEKAYSFLRDYQASEIVELKAALKATKDEDEKETLKRTIGSMENRLRAKAAKEREQEVLRQHRREEKAKVEQGKTPYYLKRSELKERTQVERFKGMKGKEREKAVERKRKKEDQREKRKMPTARRTAG